MIEDVWGWEHGLSGERMEEYVSLSFFPTFLSFPWPPRSLNLHVGLLTFLLPSPSLLHTLHLHSEEGGSQEVRACEEGSPAKPQVRKKWKAGRMRGRKGGGELKG